MAKVFDQETANTLYQITEQNPVVIEDYPYGRLRTQMRAWVESNKKGSRFCTQTKNPKTGRWNKPKCSTYSALVLIQQDETGFVQAKHLNDMPWGTQFEDFQKETQIDSTKLSESELSKYNSVVAYRKKAAEMGW